MKKKISTVLAAGAAMVAGLMSGPSTQQVVQQQLDNSTRITQAQPTRTVNQGQQTANHQRTPIRANAMMNPYVPLGSRGGYLGPKPGMSPKDYGIYLLMTGKNKYNDRRRHHWAKMTA